MYTDAERENMMQTRLSLKPGQNGTKKWVEKYGDKLVAVRYRYDEKKKKRYKTVELIVEDSHWTPIVEAEFVTRSYSSTDQIGIRVEGYETGIRAQVKEAGGIWRPRQKLWELPYSKIVELGLERCIEPEEKGEAVKKE